MPNTSLPVSVPDLDWYRDIVEGAPETILIADEHGTILFHNSQARGMDPQDFVGHPIYEYFLPEFHDIVRRKIETVFATGQLETYELASKYETEQTLWYTTRLSPIIRSGKVVAATLFIRDTTREKQTQQVLNQINLNLEQMVDQRTVTLNNYAHRLEEAERLSFALRRAGTWQEVTTMVTEHSKKVLDVDLAGVYLQAGSRLHHSITRGQTDQPPADLAAETDPFLFRLLQSSAIRYVPLIDEQADPGCSFCQYIRRQGIQSMVLAPLHSGDKTVGVLYLGSRSIRELTPEDEALIRAFVEASSNTLHRIQVMEHLEHIIRQREDELRVLYNVMSVASSVPDADSLLQKSLSITLEAVGCDMGVIHLLGINDQKLKVAASQNYPDILHNFLLLSGEVADLWEKVLASRQVVEVHQLKTQSYHEQTVEGVQVLDYIGVPLHARDVLIGVMSIFACCELFDPDKIQLVSTIADQIGLALESTQQRKLDNEALIFEERQRLARELHDSVSQSLYGLVLSADVSNKLLKVKAYSELAESLEDIGEVALQSLKEMRLMLFELRPISLESVGLVGALELRLNTVEGRANMQTTLNVTGKEYLPRAYDLDIYRVATEALNNALKHSRASQVRVDLKAGPQQVELVIRDNGVGFDISGGNGGIGLSSMQERAARIGGQLVIKSTPKRGVTVTLTVPQPAAGKADVEAAA
ncbi:MAG TPA: GAF domain-containing protein [Bellilinea sp.]|nr:GAF domain-containing protein [Bellilinea sp.]